MPFGQKLMNPLDREESWLHPHIKLRQIAVKGWGMFAEKPIQAGEILIIWGGGHTDLKGAKQGLKQGKLVMQWDDDLFSVEDFGSEDAYYINHSCDPNAWMQDAFTVVARRNIAADEEVTIDYALWEHDENHVSDWDCHCGAKLCRKKHTGSDWRLPELQERYKNHFTPLLNKKIAREHRRKKA